MCVDYGFRHAKIRAQQTGGRLILWSSQLLDGIWQKFCHYANVEPSRWYCSDWHMQMGSKTDCSCCGPSAISPSCLEQLPNESATDWRRHVDATLTAFRDYCYGQWLLNRERVDWSCGITTERTEPFRWQSILSNSGSKQHPIQ